MFAVAAFSAKRWDDSARYVESEEVLHSVFATVMGFSFIAGVVAVMSSRQLPTVKAAGPDLLALVVTVSIPMMMSSGTRGVLQRLMFVTAALWYSREAWMATSPQAAIQRPTVDHAQ